MVVVGTGIAGLTFALRAARRGPVLVITKKDRVDSNTNYARGGIAAGLGPDDDPSLHMADTLKAGHGLCHREVVEMVVGEGPRGVKKLVEWGVRFQRRGEDFALGREGGHSRRRILKAGDRTGREIERALLEAVEASDRIQLLEDTVAVDLLVEEDQSGRRSCSGLLAAHRESGEPTEIRAAATMLAAGGCGQVYRHTTNPAIATGDGPAMAHRAGAAVANMEFVQFHPTALYPTEDPAFLLTEALRGEGAVLRRLDGTSFMQDYHPDGSLAPRDVVARAIHAELEKEGDPHVLLDVSAIPSETMATAFPGTVAGCRRRDIDLEGPGIPVVPAAHYACGGVLTDSWGRSTLPGLYAAGEVACTGVHGANRLASNSLLEAVVFSRRAAEAVAGAAPPLAVRPGDEVRPEDPAFPIPPTFIGEHLAPEEQERLARSRDRLRALMWEQVSIVRWDAGLKRAAASLRELLAAEEERWPSSAWSLEALELRNLLRTARLVVESARWRKESRGLHYNRDHPGTDDDRFRRDTVIVRGRWEVAARPPEGS